MIVRYCDRCKNEIPENEPYLRVDTETMIPKDAVGAPHVKYRMELCHVCMKSILDSYTDTDKEENGNENE